MKVLTTPIPAFWGEATELPGGALADRAVAGQDERPLRLGDQVDRLLHHLVVGAGPPGLERGHRRLVALLLRDILGELDQSRARLLGLGRLERLAHHFRNRPGVPDRVRPLGDRPEHGDRIHVLVALLVQAPGAALADDAHERRPVHVGVGDAGDEVRRPGAQRSEAHPGLARQPAVGVRGEGGRLLVPAEHKSDRAVQQGDHEVGVLLPRHPEDVRDALRLQTTHEQIRCFHGPLPPVSPLFRYGHYLALRGGRRSSASARTTRDKPEPRGMSSVVSEAVPRRGLSGTVSAVLFRWRIAQRAIRAC